MPISINRFLVADFTTKKNTPRFAPVHRAGLLSGGPDGVRTRDRPVKSRTLYLTKLQAQMYVLGFLADLKGFLNSLPLILGRRTQDRAGLRTALPPIAKFRQEA